MAVKPVRVLLLDPKGVFSFSIVRSLGESKTPFTCFVMVTNPNSALRFSRYVKRVDKLPTSNAADILSHLISYIRDHAIDVILPVDEYQSRFCIENLTALSAMAKVVALPSLAMFDTAVNKDQLGSYVLAHNIAHPQTFKYTVGEGANYTFPVICKPSRGEDGKGIAICKNAEEIEQFFETVEQSYIIQPCLEGEDIDASAYCKEGTIIAYTVQRPLLAHQNPFKPAIALEMLDDQKVYALIASVIRALNWSGIINFDLRYDAQREKVYLIEINARWWGSLPASVCMGCNFPEIVLNDALGISLPHQHKRLGNYISFPGLLKHYNSLRNKGILIRSLNTNLCMILKDPLPILVKAAQKLGLCRR